ncbi:MAG: acetyl-CoA decarbonylase/synthase complex subunit gamma [Methanoregulaceae archaeon]|nr:acetyl-CoA decarbonylase/synthase complex subunit gamma [Methanoregulaceae archaeon]
MPLKALDIYKLLPRKNCKECGDPTCLTFAMKLASGKGDVDRCPYLDDQARDILGSSTRPPIRLVKVGVGERSFPIGEEMVQFRHEKTFYHPPGMMVAVSDLWTRDRIQEVVARVRDTVVVRVGTDQRLSGVAIRHLSGDPAAFRTAVEAVEEVADLPEVLMAEDPAVMEQGLAVCGHFRPLIYAATEKTDETMCNLARDYGCPLVVKADDPGRLPDLVERCKGRGVQNLVLDPAAPSLHQFQNISTAIRQQAITRSTPSLGYPVFLDAAATGMQEAAIVTGILRFASVLVLENPDQASLLAFLTLRQNIYTDPQKPIQMTPGIYRLGTPGPDSPVLLTVNFSLTFFTLQGYLEAARIPCFMVIVDTEGLSVLTAVASGKLNETLVAESLKKFSLEKEVSHRSLIIPGYAAPLSGRIEEASGWKVLVGPRDAAEIGEYLEKEWKR